MCTFVPWRWSVSADSRTQHFSTYLLPPFPAQYLPLGAPDALEEAIPLGQSVEGIVALTHCSDEATQGVDDVLALNGTTVLVNLGNRDLAGAVVLGLDNPVGRRALAGDITGRGIVRKFLCSRLFSKRETHRSTISPRSFSIFATGDVL